jgi:hypothetical protein
MTLRERLDISNPRLLRVLEYIEAHRRTAAPSGGRRRQGYCRFQRFRMPAEKCARGRAGGGSGTGIQHSPRVVE